MLGKRDFDHDRMRPGHGFADATGQPNSDFLQAFDFLMELFSRHLGQDVIDLPHMGHGILSGGCFRTGRSLKRNDPGHPISSAHLARITRLSGGPEQGEIDAVDAGASAIQSIQMNLDRQLPACLLLRKVLQVLEETGFPGEIRRLMADLGSQQGHRHGQVDGPRPAE